MVDVNSQHGSGSVRSTESRKYSLLSHPGLLTRWASQVWRSPFNRFSQGAEDLFMTLPLVNSPSFPRLEVYFLSSYAFMPLLSTITKCQGYWFRLPCPLRWHSTCLTCRFKSFRHVELRVKRGQQRGQYIRQLSSAS